MIVVSCSLFVFNLKIKIFIAEKITMEQKFRDKVYEYRFSKLLSKQTLDDVIPRLVDRFSHYHYYADHVVSCVNGEKIRAIHCQLCGRSPTFVIKMDHVVYFGWAGESWWSSLDICYACDQQRNFQQFMWRAKHKMSKFGPVIAKYLSTHVFPRIYLTSVHITDIFHFYDNCFICEGVKHNYAQRKCRTCPRPAKCSENSTCIWGKEKEKISNMDREILLSRMYAEKHRRFKLKRA
jgi:hypothetical protein